MAQSAVKKVGVASEKCGSGLLMQERNNFIVLDALATYIIANLTYWDTPTIQQFTLVARDVLVENVHVGSRIKSSLCLIRACVAN